MNAAVKAAVAAAFLAGLVWVAAATTAPGTPPSASVDLLNLPAPSTHKGETRRLLDVVAAGSRLVAVGDLGLILSSSDGAGHWTQAASPVSVMLTAVWFNDARHGWAVGHDGTVLATEDGGLQWRRQLDGRAINEQMLKAARGQLDKTLAAAGARQQGEWIESLEDRLADAEAAIEAGPSRPLLSVRFVDDQTGYAAGAYGQLIKTEDAGKTWVYIGDRLPNDTGLHLNHIAVSGSGALFIASEGGVVFRSTDHAVTWTRHEVGYNGPLYGVLPLADGFLAYGFNGHLFRGDAQGKHWVALPSPSNKSLIQAIRLPGGGVLMASQAGELLLGDEQGEHFQRYAAGNADLSGLALVPGTDRVMTVGAHGVKVTAQKLNTP